DRDQTRRRQQGPVRQGRCQRSRQSEMTIVDTPTGSCPWALFRQSPRTAGRGLCCWRKWSAPLRSPSGRAQFPGSGSILTWRIGLSKDFDRSHSALSLTEGMVMWVPPTDHPLRRVFAGATEHTFMTALGVADPPLVDYLSLLLSRFLHADDI